MVFRLLGWTTAVILHCAVGALLRSDIYEYSSSRTPYLPRNLGSKLSPVVIDKCIFEPVAFWGIVRHSTRTTSKDESDCIQEFVKFQDTLKEKLKNQPEGLFPPAETAVALATTEIIPSLKSAKADLVNAGKAEIRGIGKRWGDRLKTIFSNPNLVTLQHTKHPLTTECAGIFELAAFKKPKGAVAERLFERAESDSDPKSKANKDAAKENMKAVPSLSLPLQRLAHNVSKRIGLDVKVTEENVKALYILGCLAHAQREDHSGQVFPEVIQEDEDSLKNVKANLTPDGEVPVWFKAFEKQDLQLLAYQNDLEWHCSEGYGTKARPILALNFFKQLETFMGSYVKTSGDGKVEPDVTRALVNFSHSEAIIEICKCLGFHTRGDSVQKTLVYDGEVVEKVETYLETGVFDQFSTNIVFLLLRDVLNPTEYRVAFYLNEEPFIVPAWGVSYVPYQKFKDLLETIQN